LYIQFPYFQKWIPSALYNECHGCLWLLNCMLCFWLVLLKRRIFALSGLQCDTVDKRHHRCDAPDVHVADSCCFSRWTANGHRPGILQLFHQSGVQGLWQVHQLHTHKPLLLAQSHWNSRHLWRNLHIQQRKLSCVSKFIVIVI